MKWISVKDEIPKDGAIIDVWVSWINDRGKKTGERTAFCWVQNGLVLKGKNGRVINNYSHWLKPEPPNNEG